MNNEAAIKRVNHRVDDTNKRIDNTENDIDDIDKLLRGNGDSIGMKAEVKNNTKFVDEVKSYNKAILLLVIGNIILNIFMK